MYFSVENTPEHLKGAQKKENAQKTSPKECPRLILAPFSRPPHVIFDNVLIGTTCEKILEIYNPTKQFQQITLGKSLPPGLVIQLPGECLEVEPERCYYISMLWSPTRPMALRETIHFTNGNYGKYGVIIVLKSVMNVKSKNNNPKFKISPGRIKKKTGKKSPVASYKKQVEATYNTTTKVRKTVNVDQSTHYKVTNPMDKENVPYNKYPVDSNFKKCPFDSQTSSNVNFNISGIFSNVQRDNRDMLHETYEKSYTARNDKFNSDKNILKPSNKQICESSVSGVSEGTLTASSNLPNVALESNKLDKGQIIINSVNSESDFEDSLDGISNKENETHSIICITSSEPPNKLVTPNHQTQYESNNQCTETPALQNKRSPITSSPKKLVSPYFSMSIEISEISDSFISPQKYSTVKPLLTPERSSTVKPIIPRVYIVSHDIVDDSNMKINSDTYTIESTNTPLYHNPKEMYMDSRQPNPPKETHSKVCRQALSKEYLQYNKKDLMRPEEVPWNNYLRAEIKSPPRSFTPPLQSIPEDSIQFSETRVFDKTDQQMKTLTINRSFDKAGDKSSISSLNRQTTWSKKAVRAEPDLWNLHTALPRKSMKSKTFIQTVTKSKDSLSGRVNQSFNTNESKNQNSLNHIGNVYSQSFTVDPFLSSSAVDKFENEYKRWLNYILTPPADLDSNVEQKIDVGKVWIENRNKEVPAAPTKEQVCSAYHNSHRLDSLRRKANALLLSPKISKVLIKLNLQIEKKLIAIRSDRNLYFDIGLQKSIMKILLSYNPLWLRIALETIYGLVLPLKCNSDVEGLATFIIHRMFKNPHLKNKHSKSTASNMLLPENMEAIKKFTLKKFFTLVFFLDKAKQKKIIPHDPCLFCRNAVCKESREIILHFTRELIAGIGDITRHLRSLGYIVCHKQSYLDEYKYAVHNIADDIRDGVRLTKVMEIILMKNGLMNQLLTPAISHSQKIHNVQVALNALKEANFTIEGDISATDIADGNRAKTLSLLRQLIHVFRAPLFEKAANVIQMWWRKKYEIIIVKRREAAVKIQKFFRSYLEMKRQRHSYLSMKQAAITIQRFYRRYQESKIIRQKYCQLKSATLFVQKKYRSILNMRYHRARYLSLKRSVIVVQRRYRALLAMRKERQAYLKKKSAVIFLQSKFRAQCLMKEERKKYLKILGACRKIQAFYRAYKMGISQRKQFLKLRHAAITLQQKYRATVLMRNVRRYYLEIKFVALNLQSRFRANRMMLEAKTEYPTILKSCITIQRHYRAYVIGRKQREEYIRLKTAVITIQRRFREIMHGKKIRNNFIKLRNTVIYIQRYVRARNERRELARKRAVEKIHSWYLSIKQRNQCRSQFINVIQKIVIVQSILRMHIHRKRFVAMRTAAVTIQRCYRSYCLAKRERIKYEQLRINVIKLQAYVRCFIERKRYLRLRASVLVIQAMFRLKAHRTFLRRQRETAAICIQKNIRTYLTRSWYIQYRMQVIFVQKQWRGKILTRLLRKKFLAMRKTIVKLQALVRGHIVRKTIAHKKENLLRLKEEKRQNWAASKIQALFRGHKARMASDRHAYELRRRWRDGALHSTQKTLYQINKEALEVVHNISDIEIVIPAFRSLELVTEVHPVLYNSNAATVVRRVYVYMSLTNRSISSVEMLKSAASLLVNLTRYKITGPKIYARERIPPVLSFMWRFSNSETQLFCILSTYLWLFSKYDDVKKDLTEFLHEPENQKILNSIKGNILRMKRMANNASKNKFRTRQPAIYGSHSLRQSLRDLNHHISRKNAYLLPALEPDYGIIRANKPRYFQDPQQAICCLFETYRL